MSWLLRLFSAGQSFKGGWRRIPLWGRWLVLLFALPGILGALLSLLALGVSILALYLLTNPILRLMRWISPSEANEEDTEFIEAPYSVEDSQETEEAQTSVSQVIDPPALEAPQAPRTRRPIEVTIIEE